MLFLSMGVIKDTWAAKGKCVISTVMLKYGYMSTSRMYAVKCVLFGSMLMS